MPYFSKEQLVLPQEERVKKIYEYLVSEKAAREAVQSFLENHQRRQTGAEYLFFPFSLAALKKGERCERICIGSLVNEEGGGYTVNPALCFVVEARARPEEITLLLENDEALFEVVSAHIRKLIPEELVPEKFEEGAGNRKPFLNISRDSRSRIKMRVKACLVLPSPELFVQALTNLFNLPELPVPLK